MCKGGHGEVKPLIAGFLVRAISSVLLLLSADKLLLCACVVKKTGQSQAWGGLGSVSIDQMDCMVTPGG